MSEDRSKPPEGYGIAGHPPYDGDTWVWEVEGNLDAVFTSREEAVAGAWAHADRQRAIGKAEGYEGWTPTVENTNALPGPLQKYFQDLATLCDPAGIVAQNTLLLDQVAMLSEALKTAKADGAREERDRIIDIVLRPPGFVGPDSPLGKQCKELVACIRRTATIPTETTRVEFHDGTDAGEVVAVVDSDGNASLYPDRTPAATKIDHYLAKSATGESVRCPGCMLCKPTPTFDGNALNVGLQEGKRFVPPEGDSVEIWEGEHGEPGYNKRCAIFLVKDACTVCKKDALCLGTDGSDGEYFSGLICRECANKAWDTPTKDGTDA